MKTLQEHIELLREYNRWRRGDQPVFHRSHNDTQPDPLDVGLAIDVVLDAVENLERERDAALEQTKGWELKWKCAVEMAALAQNKAEKVWEAAK